MLPLRWYCKSKIIVHSKFQPNRTSGYRDIAILFKIWPKFGPSSGTLGPIPKKFLRCNLPYCAGSVSKFQPPSFKTVAVVWQGRTFLASPLYMKFMCNFKVKQFKSWQHDSTPAINNVHQFSSKILEVHWMSGLMDNPQSSKTWPQMADSCSAQGARRDYCPWISASCETSSSNCQRWLR